jgi:hypothetical protein
LIFDVGRGLAMTCRSRESDNLRKFTAEVAIHFPGLKNINKPTVWVFPEFLICLNCGVAECVIPETELLVLAREAIAAA